MRSSHHKDATMKATSLLLIVQIYLCFFKIISSFEMPTFKKSGGAAGLTEKAILDMLHSMTTYFHAMIDPRTDRFYYRCLPVSQKRIHEHCPIRDMGSAWDTATLLRFWRDTNQGRELVPDEEATKARLSAAVCRTIEAFSSSFASFKHDNFTILDRKLLLEPPSIAHNAFLILATAGAVRLGLLDNNKQKKVPPPINNLVNGILAMQQEDGAFRIHFDRDDIYGGIEFYPGEACLALMEAWEVAAAEHPWLLSADTRRAIVPAVERAFSFYSDFYYEGNVGSRYTSFFGNWQVQSFVRLLDALRERNDAESVREASVIADYILDLCRGIVVSEPWKALAHGSYDRLSTVEIACGLEALADGTRVALEYSHDKLASQYWHAVVQAVHFLKAVQEQVPKSSVGYGGLGYALQVQEQRLDVTGHAVNALTKVYKVHHDSANKLASIRVEL
jgi:hypothetical protein